MYDYIVVGSGIAGLYAALQAQRVGTVLLLTKARLEDSNTNHAQGGIAAAVDPADDPELHWRDTISAGAGLVDPVAAWILVREGPERICELIGLDVPFDREGGVLALAQEGAHSRPRVLHSGGDATGANIQSTLQRAARGARNITVREHHLVTDLLVEHGAVRGVNSVECRTGGRVQFLGRVVVLATGGAGCLYTHTTNPPVATGTGISLAYRAGATICDVEFCQFHPTVLALRGARRFLISEAARGEGAILRSAAGRRFMFDYDPRGELAPRHVVANAIFSETAKHGDDHVFLDLSHLDPGLVRRRFPTIFEFCWRHGLDITASPIPVSPAAHYMMGGVRTGHWGETDVPGLFACGEVACTGVHGANRLASNSLLEALVFASRIVRRTTDDSRAETARDQLPSRLSSEFDPVPEVGVSANLLGSTSQFAQLRRWEVGSGRSERSTQSPFLEPVIEEVQSVMWRLAGALRTKTGLLRARERLAALCFGHPEPAAAPEYELRDLLLLAELVVSAALAREESRGAHRRLDFPREDHEWRRRIVFRLCQSRAKPETDACRHSAAAHTAR